MSSACASAASAVDPAQLTREEVVKRCMGATMRLTLTDGRQVQGQLTCFDAERNVILHDGQVTVPASGDTPANTQSIWQVLVPGKHIVKIERKVKNEDEQGQEERKQTPTHTVGP